MADCSICGIIEIVVVSANATTQISQQYYGIEFRYLVKGKWRVRSMLPNREL